MKGVRTEVLLAKLAILLAVKEISDKHDLTFEETRLVIRSIMKDYDLFSDKENERYNEE